MKRNSERALWLTLIALLLPFMLGGCGEDSDEVYVNTDYTNVAPAYRRIVTEVHEGHTYHCVYHNGVWCNEVGE